MGNTCNRLLGCFRESNVELIAPQDNQQAPTVAAASMKQPLMNEVIVVAPTCTAQINLLEHASALFPELQDRLASMKEEYARKEVYVFPDYTIPKFTISSGMHFQRKPDSTEYLHQGFFRETVQVYPEAVLFMDLNSGFINSNFENYEVVRHETSADTIVLLYKMNSKRVLVVQPRYMFFFRVIRRVAAHCFVDFRLSVDHAGLAALSDV